MLHVFREELNAEVITQSRDFGWQLMKRAVVDNGAAL